MKTKILSSAFFWFFLFLVLAEIMAYFVSPYHKQLRAGEVARNPLHRFGWPEYVCQKEDQPSSKLVVLISNSQGVGREVSNPDEIYFAYLRKKLRAKYPDCHLENWSCSAVRTSDWELLARQAIQREAYLVIFLLSYKNIDFLSQVNLDFPAANSDVYLLAGDPWLWPKLSHSFLFSQLSYLDIARAFGCRSFHLRRAQKMVHTYIAKKTDRAQHPFIFGQHITPFKPLDQLKNFSQQESQLNWAKKNNQWMLEGRKKSYIREREKLRSSYFCPSDEEITEREYTFDHLSPALFADFHKKQTKALWLWMPLAHEVIPSNSLERIEKFHQRMEKTLEKYNVPCVDLTRCVPTQNFLTYSHLDFKGHILLSELLLPLIENALP